jgi:hypothetical protein
MYVCTGVTLGGTGKDRGDRHPKLGSGILIGAGALILGNIRIGDACKIAAGSVVLMSLPAHTTAAGVPAKVVGRAMEEKPGMELDHGLENVSFFEKRGLLARHPHTAAAASNNSSSSSSSNSSSSSSSNSSRAKQQQPAALSVNAEHKNSDSVKAACATTAACSSSADADDSGSGSRAVTAAAAVGGAQQRSSGAASRRRSDETLQSQQQQQRALRQLRCREPPSEGGRLKSFL